MFKNLCSFILSIAFLVCSSLSHADGLFDFQMKLAKKGNAEAEFKVGQMYETGFGVKRDQKQAEEWINKAAAQGHETALFRLLYWDIRKNGLKGDNKRKFTELRTKAKDGNSQAMYYVGSMYAHGVGVKQNFDKALDWLNKATFVGVLEAEREAIVVREMKQAALADSRKAKAKEKAEAERRAKKAEADKAKAEADKEKQKAQKKSAEKKELAEKRDKAAQVAKRSEEAKKKLKAEEELKKKVWLKKKEAEKKKKEEKDAKFESDPCSGKSARFLSTCR